MFPQGCGARGVPLDQRLSWRRLPSPNTKRLRRCGWLFKPVQKESSGLRSGYFLRSGRFWEGFGKGRVASQSIQSAVRKRSPIKGMIYFCCMPDVMGRAALPQSTRGTTICGTAERAAANNQAPMAFTAGWALSREEFLAAAYWAPRHFVFRAACCKSCILIGALRQQKECSSVELHTIHFVPQVVRS